MQIFRLRKEEFRASNRGKFKCGVDLNVTDFSRKFLEAARIFTLFILDWFSERVYKVSKYHVARLYSSVPINHLAHGPAIRLLEGGSYYPARLW